MSEPGSGGEAGHVPDISAILAGYDHRPDCLIEILHDIQDEHGFVPETVVPQLARGLNISRAEVHGVITFYHDFHRHPVGRHVIKICRAEACQSMGCRELEHHARRSLGIGYSDTTLDGKVTLEPVYCLGNCALSPAVMIDGELHGRVDAARFDALVAGLDGSEEAA